MLAAGLDGIEKKMDPGKRNDDNLYEIPEEELQRRGIGLLPTTLREALDCLEADRVVREALGREYAPYYIEVKREEWRQYHQHVSQWELDKYLPIY
jgi:glutamine synthetase